MALWNGEGYSVLDAEDLRYSDAVGQCRWPTIWPRDPFLDSRLRAGGVSFSPDGKTLAGFISNWAEKRVLCQWDATTAELPETTMTQPLHNEASRLKWWGNRYLVLTGMQADHRDIEPAALDRKTGLLMKQLMAPEYRKAVFARDGRLWFAVSDEREEPAKLLVVTAPDADMMEEGTGQYEEIPNLRGAFLKRLWMEPGGVFRMPKRHNPPLASGIIRQP